MKSKFKEFKEEFFKEIKEDRFKSLIVSSISLVIILYYFSSRKIVGFPVFFIYAWWIYEYKKYNSFNRERNKISKGLTEKSYDSYVFWINIVFLILTLVLSLGILPLTIYTLIIAITVIFFSSLLYSFVAFSKMKGNILSVLFVYLTLIFITVSSFAWLYAVVSGKEENVGIFSTINNTSLKQLDKLEKTNRVQDYMFFSFSVFFANGFGDLMPIGKAIRWIIVLETVFSIYFLGTTFNRVVASIKDFSEKSEQVQSKKSKSESVK